MTPIAYAKWIGIAAAVAAIALFSFHQGGLKWQAALERDHADMAAATTAALLARDQEHTAALAARQKVIDDYDAHKDDPALDPVGGLAARMYLVETSAACPGDPVREAGPVAGGAQAPGGVPRGDSEGVRLLQAALDAGRRDSLRLNAAVQLAP